MSAILTLARDGFGIELRRSTFDIEADGVCVGSIEWHETKEFSVEPESVTAFRCHAQNSSDSRFSHRRVVGSVVTPDERRLSSSLRKVSFSTVSTCTARANVSAAAR